MSITDDDKIFLANALDQFWLMNLNYQIKCQDIFQTLNRLWNNLDRRVESSGDRNDDSVKFRKFMQYALPSDVVDNFSLNQCFDKVAGIQPLIHNDAVVTAFQGSPFSESQANLLPDDVRCSAMEAHQEFNEYLIKVRENANSKNRREFRNKLCRLLYVVRSNIAHGSKINYEGSERNESICKVVYGVLIQLCNEILDNGMFRICAYGELRLGRRLNEALVANNGGIYLHQATIPGNLIHSDNTFLFNPTAEFSGVEVDVFEFTESEPIRRIDNVECMPRHFKPYFDGSLLRGFGWVYFSTKSISDPAGPVLALDRHEAVKEKVRAFLFSLRGIKGQLASKNNYNTQSAVKIFGGLTVKSGKQIDYSRNGTDSLFILPHAFDLISFVEEIDCAYRAIFDFTEDLLPFSGRLDQAIKGLKWHEETLFAAQELTLTDDETIYIFKESVTMIIEFIAIWACAQIGDEDSDAWIEIG